MTFTDFETFFEVATGHPPYPYQLTLGEEGLPPVIEVPTGCGKSAAATLGWLYALLGPDEERRRRTPRRLLYVLPMRTLVSQVEDSVQGWLQNLDLVDQVNVHVLMGGRLDVTTQNAWRIAPEQPSIIIATADSAVSRLLVRGYGSSRSAYPIDFALLTNGTHIVLDEIQLIPQATATTRQIDALRRSLGTAEPTGLTCMSATIDRHALDVVDNRWPADAKTFQLNDGDRAALGARLTAEKTISELPQIAKAADLAEAAVEKHHRGRLTLVVVNTVDVAKDVYRALSKQAPDQPKLLLHSRFRGEDKASKVARLVDAAQQGLDLIAISTQVVEAGIDIDAATLVTEAAPWPSLCQRAGRLNRAGVRPTSDLYWFAPFSSGPYVKDDVEASIQQLRTLEGVTVQSEQLQKMRVTTTSAQLRILRRTDLMSLFDTSPDLAGNDLDISPYIRDSEPLDLQATWIDPSRMDAGVLTGPTPPEPLRCSVRHKNLDAFLRRTTKPQEHAPQAWRFSPTENRWVPVRSSRGIHPNDLILISAASGGYDPEIGFDPGSRDRVAQEEPELQVPQTPDGPEADNESGSLGQPAWQSLSRHLWETRREATEVLTGIGREEAADLTLSVQTAAELHDLGKAFPGWQAGLLATHPDNPPPRVDTWAKSPRTAKGVRLQVLREGKLRKAFRHELVSVIYLSGDAGTDLLDDLGVPAARHDLVRYLVGAHHGHLRLQPRDPMADGHDGRSLLGLFDGEELSSFTWKDRELGDRTVDLGLFSAGDGTWSAAAQQLLEEFGPFTLAYLETLVRMADWRASALLITDDDDLEEDPS